MNIAVVADELLLREQLIKTITQWTGDRQRETTEDMMFSVDGYADSESFRGAAQTQRFDLVILDIDMQYMNGIETAAQLHQRYRQCAVIFLASGRKHMPDAFCVHAFDYLLKPVNEQRLLSALEYITAAMTQWQQTLQIPMGRSTVAVRYSSIQCITADAQYCLVYSGDVCRVRITFRELTLPLTKDARFLVINRGVLVNMDYVIRMENNICLMNNGLQLPVNTRNRSKLRQTLTNYRFTCHANHVTGGRI